MVQPKKGVKVVDVVLQANAARIIIDKRRALALVDGIGTTASL